MDERKAKTAGNKESKQKSGDLCGADDVRAAALKHLSIRGHSCAELERKLIKSGALPAAVQEVLSYLKESGYLDEQKLADDYVRRRGEAAHYGSHRLRGELLQKGLSETLIARALANNYDDEDELAACRAFFDKQTEAFAVWRKKKANEQDRLDVKTREKIYRKALNRGFPSSIVMKALADLAIVNDDKI